MNTEIKPCRLLVIEDNMADFVLLKHFLQFSNLPFEKILHAESIAAASSFFTDNSFDIILVDLTLPDSVGVDSVITLDRLTPQTPIIVFSGLSTIETAIECISLGAQDYLIKGEFDEKLLGKSIQYSIERKRNIEKLRQINDRYELVNRATLDIIWEWNYLTRKGRWGEGIIKIFGYTEKEKNYDENWINEYIHPNDRERVIVNIQSCIEAGLRNWQNEYRFRCADGKYKNVYDRGYILYAANGKPYRMIGAMTDITERKRLEKDLAEQQLKEQKLITEVAIQVQEKERNDLGRELHDNINQLLVTAKMFLGIVKSGQGETAELVERSYEYLGEAIQEIRKLSHTLVAPSLGDIGLKESLEELIGDAHLLNGMQVKLSVSADYSEETIDERQKLMLYRIVQEQLNNITKYASAKNVVITIKTKKEELFLSVSDNGVGFDPSQKSKGIGLKNISSRIEFYSGHMNIISAPGQGCTLEIYLPHEQSINVL